MKLSCNLPGTSLIVFSGWGHDFTWLSYTEGFDELVLLDNIYADPKLVNDAISAQTIHLSGRVLLLGWSIGAITALQYAAANQDHVSGVISLAGCSSFCGKDRFKNGARVEEVLALKRQLKANTKGAALSFLERVHPNLSKEFLRKQFLPAFLSQQIQNLSGGLDFLVQTDLDEVLSDLSVPVLLAHGGKDEVIPSSASQALANSITNSCLIELKDSHHNFVYQDLFEINEVMGKFFPKN